MSGPEPLDIARQHLAGSGEVPCVDETGELAVAAAGEQDQPLGVVAQVGGDCLILPILFVLVLIEQDGQRGTAVVEGGQEAAEVAVAGAGFGEQGEMRAIGEGDFGAGDGCHAGGIGHPGELHRAVEAIVIGDGQRDVAEADRLVDDVFREGGAIEEGVGGVEVQLGIDRHRAVVGVR